MIKLEQGYYENQCLWFNQTRYLLKNLEKKAFHLANIFRDRGIEHQKENKVLIILRRSPALFVAHYSTFLAGGVIVSIDPETPMERLNVIIEDVNPHVILTHYNNSLSIRGDKRKVIYLEEDLRSLTETDSFPLNERGKFSLNSAAYIIFTSGTTGKPKGVIVEWKSLFKLMEWYTETYKVNSSSLVSLTASPGFDAAIMETWGAIGAKSSIHIATDDERLLPDELQKAWSTYKVTHSFASTPITERLLDLPWKDTETTLQYLFVGGDKLKKFPSNKIPFQIVNVYGPCEATVATSEGIIHPKEDEEYEVPHIGTPLSYIDSFILDENGDEITKIDKQGILWVSGIALARGYLNLEEETNEKFKKININGNFIRAYNTGDIVSKGKDGNYHFHGRRDFQISINGVRVELGEIEKALLECTKILYTTVLPIEYNSKQMIVASVVLEENSEFKEGEIKEYLRKKLPLNMVPIQILSHTQMPLTDNGKIDRRKLNNLHEKFLRKKQNLKELEGLEFGSSSVMTRIIEIFTDVLQGQCAPGTDIFEAGGNSLDAARIAAKISDIFNVKYLPQLILKEKTPINIFASLQSLQKTINKQNIETYTPKNDWLPITSMQKGLWYLWQTNENNSFYNIGATFHLKEEINLNFLHEVIVNIIKSENVFATIFRENGSGEVEKYIHGDFDTVKWFQQINVNTIEEAFAQSNKIYNTNFDLEKDLLIRGALLKTEKEGVVLVLATHHIVCDGLSLQKILKDISLAYNSRCSKVNKRENVQHIEYLTSDNVQQSTYWKEKGKNFHLAQISMKEDADSLLTKGEIYECTSRLNIGKSIEQMASSYKISKFIILLTGWVINLTKYFRQETITIGIPYHGRKNGDFNEVGMFVNLLPVTITVSKNKTFITLLNEVNDLVQQHVVQGDFSIVDIVSISTNRKQFDIINNTFSEKIKLDLILGDKRVNFIEQDTGGARFPLSGFFQVQDGEIVGHVEYSFANFENSDIKILTDSYFDLMQSLIRLPNRQWNGAFKGTSVIEAQVGPNFKDDSKTLHNLFENSVEKFDDYIAVEDCTGAWSYSKLNHNANKIASMLYSKGVRKGDYIAVFMTRSKEMLAVIIGILKIGAIYVPLDVEYPEERIKSILNKVHPRIIVCNKSIDFISADKWELIYVNDIEVYQNLLLFENGKIGLEDPAYLMFTSGSTGKPKGVLCPHHGASLRILWQKNQKHLKPSDRVLFKTPYTFDVSIWEIFYTLSVGATLVIGNNDLHKEPEKIYKFIKNKAITYCHFVPSVFQFVLDCFEKSRDNEHSLKYVHLSGETVSKRLAKKIQDILPNVRVFNLYGPTEAGIEVTVQEISNEIYNIGKPLPYVSLQIVDQDENPVPIGFPGELLIGGPSLAIEYFNDEEETNKAFITKGSKRYYKTGDLAKLLDNGSIDFLGRKDYQVKLNGIRIETEEIERCVTALPSIKDATVIFVEESTKKQLICFYSLIGKGSSTNFDIKKQVSNKLPVTYIPSAFIEISEFPLTSSGKRDRKRLNDMALEYLNNKIQLNFIEARTELEKSIVKVWSEVLKIKQIGLNDNFFELGGDSIKSLQIVSKLRKNGINFSPKDFLKHPTILELMEILN